MGDYSPVVACQEVHDSIRENRSSTGWTLEVTLQCAWADRYALIIDLLDTPRYHPTNTWLAALDATIEPLPAKYTQDGQEIVYEEAFVAVKYGVLGNDTDNDKPTPQDPVKLISETIEPYTQVIRIPPEKYLWKSTVGGITNRELTKEEAPGKVIHGIKLTRTWFKVASIPSDILEFPGTVHDAQYTSNILGLTFPAETLLFLPPRISRNVTTVGGGAWEMRLSWDYKESGWNRFYRADVVNEPDGPTIYQGYDSIVLKRDGSDVDVFPRKNQSGFLF